MEIDLTREDFERLQEENARLHLALISLYEWYDTDGSVGTASDVFEDHRSVTQQLTRES